MIQNKKIELLDAWKDRPFGELSISEIMRITGKRTKPWVFNSLKELVKNRLLLSERKGNLDLYSLNLENPFLIQALQYLESQRSLNFPSLDIIMEIISKVPVRNYCLLVFGSYAKGRQAKGSDMDVCFLVENEQAEKRIKPYTDAVKLNHEIRIDEHCITFDDFMKMLLREEENLGKQIYRKHMLFFNPDIYYQLLREAHKHGFRG
ncbi:MAG: nucleotidyltransferase domain-containing protein [Candidatus Aenigmarchaeota archaeon]|nr:nucleotidyltransferase domain-containing protein [Candidatus Aenigmarchaeota archaeon]